MPSGQKQTNLKDFELAADLAQGMSITDCARKFKVCRSTVYARLKESEFQSLLRQIRSGLVAETYGALLTALRTSTSNIIDIANSRGNIFNKVCGQPALLSVVLAANRFIVEQATKARENEYAEKLEELIQRGEEQVQIQKTWNLER